MIEVLIADDHTMFRDGLRQILSDEGDIVVDQAVDGDDALRKLGARDFDVVILDMSMPGKSGVALIEQIRRMKPKLPILVLSMHGQRQYAVQALKAGASGYVTKTSSASQLVGGIRKVARGGTYVSEEIAAKLALQLKNPEASAPHASLTRREFQVFEMIVAGRKVSEIAKALSRSVKTISTHKGKVMEKIGASSTAGLVYYAVKHGLVDEGHEPDGEA